MSSPPKKQLCSLCLTVECTQSESDSTKGETESQSRPSKESIGSLEVLPNELIGLIMENLSFKELSQFTLTNKWFRDFILQHFFDSKKGLKALLGRHLEAKNASSVEQQKERLKAFGQLGLLMKRMTCLFPTARRLELLIQVFYRLDGIPEPSNNGKTSYRIRFTFQCYGQLLHRLVAGWDDSELKYVFKKLINITHMETHIQTVINSNIGVRQSIEYYIRSFYRMICIDTVLENDKSKDYSDTMFWMNRILRKRSLEVRAKMMTIFYGPLISSSPTPSSMPYIGWWDLTDTFFIETGLEEMGVALCILYTNQKTAEDRNNVVSLMEMIIRKPEVWLIENEASLLFHAGDEITFDYLYSKLKNGNYTDVAQKLVYLSVVSFKLLGETKLVYKLIKKLAFDENNNNLYREVKIAFTEAIVEALNAVDIEDEREVIEVSDISEANNDLFMWFMIGLSPDSSQSSASDEKCSQTKIEDQIEE